MTEMEQKKKNSVNGQESEWDEPFCIPCTNCGMCQRQKKLIPGTKRAGP